MFTGIIQGIGTVMDSFKTEGGLRYAVSLPPPLLESLKEGSSVSINGACQTVADIDSSLVWFDAIFETLEKTTLGNLYPGAIVNAENSACFGDPIGGHLVYGHIDGTALIKKIEHNRFWIEFPEAWRKYFFLKGSVALDGVGLTLSSVDRNHDLFSVDLIPQTLKATTFFKKMEEDRVNVEIDALAKMAVETIQGWQKIS